MRIALSAMIIAVVAGAAVAAPLTSLAFTPSAPVVDFESFAVGTSGPIKVGPMTVSSPSWTVRSQGFTQFPGIFEGQYFGFGPNSFTIEFVGDMRAVGFGLFDPNFSGTRLEVFDRGGTLLETVFPLTGPIGGGFSTFTGVQRVTAEIARIVVTPQSGDFLAVDTIAWDAGVPAVPVPPAAGLLIGGLGMLAAVRRRR